MERQAGREMTDSERVTKQVSIELANRMLPLVRHIAGDLQQQFHVVTGLKERLSQLRRRRRKSNRQSDALYQDEVVQFESDLEAAQEQLDRYVVELEKLGLVVVDASRGAIGFPAQMDGREVRLSWMPGEEEVGWWHEVADGLKSRHSLFAESKGGDGNLAGDWQS